MIKLTGVLPVLECTRNQYHHQGYQAPEQDDSFKDCLQDADQKKRQKSVQMCEQEIQTLWHELSNDCRRLKLLVHPNVYVSMSEDSAYGIRIKKRLSDCFMENSMIYPAITLAMLDVGEVYVRFAYNGDISYSTSSVM